MLNHSNVEVLTRLGKAMLLVHHAHLLIYPLDIPQSVRTQ